MTRHRWILTYGVALHLLWGLAILSDPSAVRTTPTYLLGQLVPNTTLLAMVLLCSSWLAAQVVTEPVLQPKHVLFLIPQQVLMLVAAAGALGRILVGAYADGVLRSNQFLLVDQAPNVIAAVLQTWLLCSVLLMHIRGRLWSIPVSS